MNDQRKSGTILSYLLILANILSGLVYTPILLRVLGQSEYGLYQLCYSVVSYLTLLSMGFTSSYMRFYSRCKAKKDDKAVADLNGMYLIIFIVIALITIILGVIMVVNVNGILGTGLSKGELSKSKILMSFMVYNVALSFILSVFSSIISAHEEFVFQRILAIIIKLGTPFLTMPMLLIFNIGSIMVVIVVSFMTTLDFLFEMIFCLKKLKTKFKFDSLEWERFKELGNFTFWIFMMQMVGQINWNLDNFLLGRMQGTISVAIYGVGSAIFAMYQYFPSVLCNIFSPKVNMLVAEKNEKEVSKLFIKVSRIQYIIIMLVMTGFVIFGKPFIHFWSGADYDQSYYVALLLMISATIPFAQNLGIEIQTAMNKHQARSIVYSIIAIFNVLMSVVFIKYWGATGAALGTAIALVLGNTIFMNWYYYKIIRLDIVGFWKNIVRISLSFIIPIGIGIAYRIVFNVNKSILALIGGIALYTFVFCVSIWKCGLDHYEQNLIQQLSANIIKKIKGMRVDT